MKLYTSSCCCVNVIRREDARDRKKRKKQRKEKRDVFNKKKKGWNVPPKRSSHLEKIYALHSWITTKRQLTIH